MDWPIKPESSRESRGSTLAPFFRSEIVAEYILGIIIRRKRRLSAAIAACNFMPKRNVTNRAAMPHFYFIARGRGPRAHIRRSTFRESRVLSPLFIEFRIKKKGMTPASFYRTSLEPTILVRSLGEEHLSVARAHTYTSVRARSKSFNAVVLSPTN